MVAIRRGTLGTAESLARDPAVHTPLTTEELAALQGAGSVGSVEDGRAHVWEHDAEVDALIEDVRRSRRANVA